MNLESYGNIYVCHDCYFAVHYGSHEHEGQWYSGESDTPADCEPMGQIGDDFLTFDNTCSEHEAEERWVVEPYEDDPDNGEEVQDGYWPCQHCGQSGWDEPAGSGIEEFTWRSCQGCGSHLGGSRYRLSLWKEDANAQVP